MLLSYGFGETAGTVAYPTSGPHLFALHSSHSVDGTGALTDDRSYAPRVSPNLAGYPLVALAGKSGWTVSFEAYLWPSAGHPDAAGLLDLQTWDGPLLGAGVTAAGDLQIWSGGTVIQSVSLDGHRDDWVQFGFTWEGSTLRVQVKHGATIILLDPMDCPNQDLTAAWFGSWSYEGSTGHASYGHSVRNVRIYDEALSSAQVSALYGVAVEPAPAVTLRPVQRQLVFAGTAGEAITNAQRATVVSGTDGVAQSWTVSADQPWLTLSATSGSTPSGYTDITVDTSGLAVGVHEATVTFADTVSADTVDVQVLLNLRPDLPVTVTTWKGNKAGAFSSTTDDGPTSGLAKLNAAGYKGMFVPNTLVNLEVWGNIAGAAEAGHEIGAHTVSHICEPTILTRGAAIQEITGNVQATIRQYMPMNRTTSMAWPCGWFPSFEYAHNAAQYMLAARGYGINHLEQTTPRDWYNVYSFNSHEHAEYGQIEDYGPQPADLKAIVDDAASTGKWANLTMHTMTNDDDAIPYAATQNVWCAPFGTVVRYILQRDRTLIDDYAVDGDVTFTVSRLPLPPMASREVEDTVDATDTVTMRVELAEPGVQWVGVNGHPVPFTEAVENEQPVAYFEVAPTPTAASVLVSYTEPPSGRYWYTGAGAALVGYQLTGDGLVALA